MKLKNFLRGLAVGLLLLGAGIPATQAKVQTNLAQGVDDGGTAVPVEIAAYGGSYVYNGQLNTPCDYLWAPSGSLCDEPPTTDDPCISSKTNTHSGATWFGNFGLGTGVLVIDLGEVKTFDVAQVFQMFSDGKTTHFRIFSHSASGATPPGWQDAGWTALNGFDLIGPGTVLGLGDQVSDPTSISFSATSSRYVKLELRNDGSYDSAYWTELRCLKLFDSTGSNCFDTNQPPTADAGPDQAIRAGDTVDLDGSASSDDNTSPEFLAYLWTLTKPEGSTATLSGADTAIPSFVADVAGTYTVELVVTDEGGLPSLADYVEISSNNLAPTAVATVDYGLAIVETISNFDGSGSSDPEGDTLGYDWQITSAPLGSTAVLVGGDTANPSLTTDVEGTYEVTLTVSDFLGAGTPAMVEFVATTPQNYAEIKIVDASDLVGALLPGQVTTKGNQTALGNFLKNATKNIQKGDIAKAIDDLNKARERTDGVVLRGVPDGNGNGMDWITDSSAQVEAYNLLTAAIDALSN